MVAVILLLMSTLKHFCSDQGLMLETMALASLMQWLKFSTLGRTIWFLRGGGKEFKDLEKVIPAIPGERKNGQHY